MNNKGNGINVIHNMNVPSFNKKQIEQNQIEQNQIKSNHTWYRANSK